MNSFEARFRTDKVYFYCRKTKVGKARRLSIVEHKEKNREIAAAFSLRT